MSLRDWARRTKMQMDVMGTRAGARAAGLSLWQGMVSRAGRCLSDGQSKTVWERDWDVLVLLDACRPEPLTTVSNEYDFLPASIPTTDSPASCSKRWLESHFTPEYNDEVGKTAYVTGNVFSREFGSDGLVNAGDFAALHEVWRDGWNEDIGTVSPRAMTDEAIRTWRSEECERMIVHYMQPHAPYRGLHTPTGFDDPCESLGNHRLTVWDLLRGGQITEYEARSAYRDNLRWGLDEVSALLENCDASDVVISADHGELFGKYGLHSHPDVPVDGLRTVPWIETTAVDDRTRVPGKTESETNETEASVTDRLQALGYA